MKVGFWDADLRKEYWFKCSILITIYSIPVTVMETQAVKIWGLILLIFLSVGIILWSWYRANHIKSLVLSINKTEIEIKEGDIFATKGLKVIPFNEFFDTQVDNDLISDSSLNGQYITRFYKNPSDLETVIERNKHSTERIIEKGYEREEGKSTRYALGTIVENGEYLLLAFSHFDEKNRAFLSVQDYVTCLLRMWEECDILYNGRSIVLPLLGAGITRFRDHKEITDQELLETILWSFKVSRLRLKASAKLTILLTSATLKNVNLYAIMKRFTA